MSQCQRAACRPAAVLSPSLYFVLFLVAVFAAQSPVASAGGVYCGRETVYCPLSSPICCGDTFSHYCVPAGYKCCDAFGTEMSAGMCAQNEECCRTFTGTKCCEPGTHCVLGGLGYGTCQSDVCSTYSTQETCTSGGCGWCCEEHRCVSMQQYDSQWPNQGCMKPPLTEKTSRCPSRCHEADTCTRCTAASDSSDSGDGGCAWCCASMTCMSAAEAGRACPNDQYVLKAGKCHGCYRDGAGVSPHVGDGLTWYSLGAFSLMMLALISFGVCIRVVQSVLSAREKVTTQQVQESIRRYGFTAADAQPSSPIVRNRVPSSGDGAGPSLATPEAESSAAAPTEDDSHATDGAGDGASSGRDAAAVEETAVVTISGNLCSACRRPVRLSDLVAHLDPTPPAPSASASGGGTSAPTEARSPPPPVSPPALQGVAATGAGEGQPPEAPETAAAAAKDDPIIIFLPCGHYCCYDCVGVPKEARVPPPPADAPSAAPAAADGTPAPTPAQQHQEMLEKAVKKKRKGKCPACKKKYTDLLFTDRVRTI